MTVVVQGTEGREAFVPTSRGRVAPIVAAPGIQVSGMGIGLGARAYAAIQQQYALVPGQYRWLHEYRGAHPHPQHQRLAGRTFNGEYILEGGINWFPGDHAGCVCVGVPDFVEVGP